MVIMPVLKKPKVEEGENDEAESREKVMMVLIKHRRKEVESLETMVTHYISELEGAKKRLEDSLSELDHIRSRVRSKLPLRVDAVPAAPNVPTQRIQTSSSQTEGFLEKPKKQCPYASRPIPKSNSNNRESVFQPSNSNTKLGMQKGHRDLITSVRSSTSPDLIHFGHATHIHSNHKRKLRSLALNPVNGELLVTSSLDGIVNLWKLQTKETTASLLSTTNLASPKTRRWPEDITWHPDGYRIFAAYSADGGHSQISILNINLSPERVSFLEEKPHTKGIINSIAFMPWEEEACFATGGSDHAVVVWTQKEEGSWRPKTIHSTEHSSAVMGVAGLHHNNIILSVGVDRRLICFDLVAENTRFKRRLDTKCLAVLPNPSDYNLFMVQTGAHWRQLSLFDVRTSGTEVHAFGFKQESSESHSALIKPAWSPDGLRVSSGSPDPKIHIFDIRYNAVNPAQSLQAHQKRVFKAEWHRSAPLIVSISSDLYIGLHHIS